MSFKRDSIFASLPAVKRGAPCFLGADPKGENFLYTCGQSVIIRNIHNPIIADMYDEHQHTPTVAKYAPSGFYIASGDSSGTIRIWDTTQAEHPLKIELRVLSGAIHDIDWSEDSKRIVVGGDGREKYGHAFLWDSGSSVGEIAGHSKPIYSVSMKPSRPYRVVTGSEDFVVNWYEGPPFKYKGKKEDHTRFVNCVRFAPNGSLFASVGSDKNGFLYDGKTGEKVGQLSADGGHTGGIYCCSWSPDSRRLLTASGDRSCKIWDVETRQCLTTFQFGKDTNFQQLGCLWQGNYLLSVNLAGEITYLDENNPDKPLRVLHGHNVAITGLAYDSAKNQIYSGSYDAKIVRWNADTGDNVNASGQGHSNQISQIAHANGQLVTGCMDDSIRVTPMDTFEYTSDKIGTDSPVAGVAVAGDVSVGVTMKSIVVIIRGVQVRAQNISYSGKSIAISPDGKEVAVGGDDNLIHLYTLNGDNLSEKGTLSLHRDHVTALAYSAQGELASAGKDRNVAVWDTATAEPKISGWCFHTARIDSVAWAPDGIHLATGGLDQDIYVWTTAQKMKRIHIKGAHRGGCTSVTWIDNETLLSAGTDSTVKRWKITHH